MKKLFTILLIAAAPYGLMAQNAVRNCGTMSNLERLIRENPEVAMKMAEIEAQTARSIENQRGNRAEAANITIPVVVHVVYKTASQNISDAQINSQIAVLNADFQKMNADVALTPSLFTGVVGNPNIGFCLAKTDPSGNPTTGIVRVATTKTSFSDNDAVKKAANGGSNAWDATKYLNLWVCNLGSSLLGYAQFPGGPNATDGVVCNYTAFGTTGTAQAPFHKGRTATHEVGHWLNLRHIWGDASCGNDQVNDTPTQQTANTGCPSFPRKTCNNTSDMFMNYMDYTDDACMYMFSTGQSTRMNALFASGGARIGLVTSNKCGTVVQPTVCAVPAGQSTSGVSNTTATLSWGAVSGAASYNVQYRATGAANWISANTTATSRSLTGLVASTGYEWQVQSVCGGTLGSSGFSGSANFATLATPPVTYCTAGGTNTNDEWIAFFGLGSISNTSGGQNGAGYENFTALSTSLTRGTTYTATYRTGYSGTAYSEVFRIYIDLNGDGDFADAGETVASPAASASTANRTSSFTVPATASVGSTRLRVIMKYSTAPTSSCGSFTYGQVEDYTVNITSARLSGLANTQVSVFPNPAEKTAFVNVTNLPNDMNNVTISLRDLQGRTLWTGKLEAGRDIQEYAVPVHTLADGLYLMQLDVNGEKMVQKLKVSR